jgi:hypothetical protein
VNVSVGTDGDGEVAEEVLDDFEGGAGGEGEGEGTRCRGIDRECAVRRCGLSGGERPSPLILSQQDGGAGGSLIRVVPGRVGAALTKPGRVSTAR